MTPELRLIRYFVTVADEGNVTKAARRLHIAQPSLSAALRQLETQLGVELFRRDGTRLALTPAGALLHRRAPPPSPSAPAGRLRRRWSLSRCTKSARSSTSRVTTHSRTRTP